jgi:DeoR/GlpR family transcriptional regulator of sugar metabolism
VIIQSGPEIIPLANHSKFGKISAAFVATIQAIHKLITDTKTPEESFKEIRSMGIEVIQV